VVIMAGVGQTYPRLPYAEGEIIVKLKPSASKKAIQEHPYYYALKNIRKDLKLFRVRIKKGIDPVQAARVFARLEYVEYAEPNWILEALPVPNDPYFLDDPDPGSNWNADQWGLFDINAPLAWNITRGSSQVLVAVVDSGIDLDHPDLAANIWTNTGEIPDNGIDDDGNGYIDDFHGYDFAGSNVGASGDPPDSEDSNPDVFAGDPSCGDGLDNDNDGYADDGVSHGTDVAGVIAAVTDNGQGIAGTAWYAHLMAVRALNAEGWGYASDIASGITYAADNGAKVINLSLGSSTPSSTIQDAVIYAHNSGAVVICASGNSGSTPILYPARYSETIAVGSCNWLGERSGFSCYGNELDLVAPGERILTTYVKSVDSGDPGKPSYAFVSGTSLATPFVSGVAALILSTNSSITPEDIRTALHNGCDDLDSPGFDKYTGYGRVNAYKSILYANATSITIPEIAFHTGWNMIAIPGIPLDNSASSVLSDLIDAGNVLDGSLYEYEEGSYRQYPQEFTTLSPGKGYWLYITNPVANTYTGMEISWDFEISLSAGWNLIGYPFLSSQQFSSCHIKRGGVLYTLQEAINNNWLLEDIYSYTAGGYTMHDLTSQDSFQPFTAYWVLALEDDITLIIPAP